MNSPNPSPMQFEVVDPDGADAAAGKDPKVMPPIVAAPPPPAAVTDDDTVGGESDESLRKTDEVSTKRPHSLSVRIGVSVGLLVVLIVGGGFLYSLATPGRASIKAPSIPAVASVDGTYHWAKDTQKWMGGTLLPDQLAQWKQIDVLKAQVSDLKSQLGAAKVGSPSGGSWTGDAAFAMSSLMFLAFLAGTISRARAKRREMHDEN